MNRRGIDEMMEMRFEIVYSKNCSRRKGFWRIFTIFDLFFGKFKISKTDGMIEINFETVWELFYKKKKISIIFIKKLLKFLKFLIKFF